MFVLFGDSALSAFRVQQLLDKCQQSNFDVSGLRASFLYLLQSEPADELKARVLKLLGASDNAPFAADFIVAPRPGTISPWSSKATDILRNCGVDCERIERAIIWQVTGDVSHQQKNLQALLHDRMTESVFTGVEDVAQLFRQQAPAALNTIDVIAGGKQQLAVANEQLGFALSADEIDYLVDGFQQVGRNPTDAELMMFAQANSEHCRHKIFNASWQIDGVSADASLFGMIRETHRAQPEGTLVAYDDNAAVIQGHNAERLMIDPVSRTYADCAEPANVQIKVETHNHPTAISPYAGAATGAGGEIRDEGATGNGAKPKAGLCGFSVSNLRIPGFTHEWEQHAGKPSHIASALDIMIDGPIGAASYNNEFGRPNLAGYFRTLEMPVTDVEESQWFGYHKPIMIAGGMGNIRPCNTHKKPVPAGSAIAVLGGPAMLIGLGGGAASSMSSGQSDQSLDFASVQRDNPEMQRRCQEVINTCVAMGDTSPVLSMHDVGAGGLSNALPELVHDAGRGAEFDLRRILIDEAGMSPMEIWCNESQERYVMAIDGDKLAEFEAICRRERCPVSIVGHATEELQLTVRDSLLGKDAIDMSLDLLLGKPPRMHRTGTRRAPVVSSLQLQDLGIADAVDRVLSAPAVAAKNFLITIGDRTVGGLVHRDQLVGPRQMPVADAAVTLADFSGYSGETMAIGERTPLAMISPVASGRMAVAEALTNIMSAAIGDIKQIKLSANWMAATGDAVADAALFDTVEAVARGLCPALGLSIPVGKDSLSMKSTWQQPASEHSASEHSAPEHAEPEQLAAEHLAKEHLAAENGSAAKTKTVAAPLSLVITAFAPVADVRMARTPELKPVADNALYLVDLSGGKNRLGGSTLAQVYQRIGDETPDVDSAENLLGLYNAIQQLLQQEKILAIHDRSDGGLFACVAEMCFAGNCGAAIDLPVIGETGIVGSLFSEEPGVVFQVANASDRTLIESVFNAYGIGHCLHRVGRATQQQELHFSSNGAPVYSGAVADLRKQWWQTSYQMQKRRDNPECAEQELELIASDDPGLTPVLTFAPEDNVVQSTGAKPKIAILREQGVNGHIEMAAAFKQSGFDCIDVHMTDIINGVTGLADFHGLAACGGFSYGDVIGAGGGWAGSIRYNTAAASEFSAFFERADVFALGVCNGCQMMSHLQDLIPGAAHWPEFRRNRSEQFEARLCTVQVEPSPSILLAGMEGSRIPVVISHGEGRVDSDSASTVSLRYTDNSGEVTERYPHNPNGSIAGVAGLCSDDGRFNIMMPHPERVFRTVQHSWTPSTWGERGPWSVMFDNARNWVRAS